MKNMKLLFSIVILLIFGAELISAAASVDIKSVTQISPANNANVINPINYSWLVNFSWAAGGPAYTGCDVSLDCYVIADSRLMCHKGILYVGGGNSSDSKIFSCSNTTYSFSPGSHSWYVACEMEGGGLSTGDNDQTYNCGDFVSDAMNSSNRTFIIPSANVDLVSNISANTSSVYVNQKVRFTINTTNIGTASALASATAVMNGASPQGYFSIPSLSAGSSDIQYYNWTCTSPGTYTFNSRADYTNTNAESNENNNYGTQRTINCYSASQPDLISNISANTSSVYVNQKVRFTITTQNIGTASSNSSITALLRNGTTLFNFSISTLTQGTSATNTYDWTCTSPGTYTFNSSADYTSTNAESNENNNYGLLPELSIICGNLADSEAPTITLISPPNGTQFNSRGQKNLTWVAVDDSSSTMVCELFVEHTKDSITRNERYPGINASNGTNISYSYNALDFTKYYWHVVCNDSANNSGTSETWEFKLGTGDMNAPIIFQVRPDNGAYFNETGSRNLVWWADDDVSTILSCMVYLNNNTINTTDVPVHTNITILTPFLNFGTYYWRVLCVDENDNTGNSDNWNFTVKRTVCGDNICEGYETCTNCQQDCGICQPVCGNSILETGEQCEVNIACTDAGMLCNYTSCQCYQSTHCGDGICNNNENCTTCPSDCGLCLDCSENGVCNPQCLEDPDCCQSDSDCPSDYECRNQTCTDCSKDSTCNQQCLNDPDCCDSNSDCRQGEICSGGTCIKSNRTGCNYNNPPCGECFACVENKCVDLRRTLYIESQIEVPINSTVSATVYDENNHTQPGLYVNVTDPLNKSTVYIADRTGTIHYIAQHIGYYYYTIPCANLSAKTRIVSVYDPEAQPTNKKIVVPLYVTEASTMELEAISLGRPIKASIKIDAPGNKVFNTTTDNMGRYETTLINLGKYTVTISATNVKSLSAKIDLNPIPAKKSTLEDPGLLLLLLIILVLIIAAYLMRNKLIPLITGKRSASVQFIPAEPKAGEEVIITLSDEKGISFKNTQFTIISDSGEVFQLTTDEKGRALFTPMRKGIYLVSSDVLDIKGGRIEVR